MSDNTAWVPEELIEDIHYHLNRYNESKTRSGAGHHLIELFNKVNDLTTWHSGFDVETGTMPWQREDNG